jgi:hypothetical protein
VSDQYPDAGEGSSGTTAGPDAMLPPATTIRPDPAVPDLESCLIVVASYAGSAALVESITADAARRVMLSPVLAAFIDLRFVNLGPQPDHGEHSSALSRITSQLVQPRPSAKRSFFSVVVLDKLATMAEAVLTECAESPFLHELPLRLRGIASIEDRIRISPRGSKILVSPTGAWHREELVRELRRYADELLYELAGARQEGVGPAKLTKLHDRYQAQAAQEPAVLPPTETDAGNLPASPGAAPGGDGTADQPGPPPAPPVPDALDPVAPPEPVPEPAPAPAPVTLEPPEPGQNESAPQAGTPEQPGGTIPAPLPAASGPATSLAGPEAATPPDPGARPTPRGSLPRLSHLLPQVRWPHAGRALDTRADQLQPTSTGLVYLLLTGDESTGERDEWSRARTVMLEVDKRLAELPQVSCHVRVLQGNELGLRGDLRPAGKLRKRDLRDSVADLYFADILPEIGQILHRDQGSCGTSDRPLNRPAVVFVAPEPPLADSAAAESLRALAAEASVAWVVPSSHAGLISDDFTGAARVFTNFESVADDVAALVTFAAGTASDPSTVPKSQEPGLDPDGEDPGSAPTPEVAASQSQR